MAPDPSESPESELTAGERAALAAILAVILPSTSGAGATEAGAVDYVAGRLATEDADQLPGLRAVLVRSGDPGAFVAALAASDAPAARALFARLRAWAWEGFLCDPARSGNRDGVGWARFGFGGSPKARGYPEPQ